MHHAYENIRERYVHILNGIFYVSMHNSYIDMELVYSKIKKSFGSYGLLGELFHQRTTATVTNSFHFKVTAASMKIGITYMGI